MNGEIDIKIIKKPVLYPLCRGENRKSQLLFIIDGVVINAAVIITTGVFLSGYIVYLKGSDFLVGLLNNSATWSMIVALFSFTIYERMRRRKRLLLCLNITARLLICCTIFLPLLSADSSFLLGSVSVMIVLGNIAWGIYGIGVNVWMMGMMPRESRSQYIYMRTFCLRISFTLSTIIMGFVLDWFRKGYIGFLIAFSTSLLLSLIDVLILASIKEPENEVMTNSTSMFRNFMEPIKDLQYRSFLGFIFFFYLVLTLSSSFTSLYFIRYLDFNYSFISTVNVTIYFLMIVCTKFWSKIEVKRGMNFVLRATAFIMIFEYFVYSFLTKDRYYLLFLASTLSGIGSSGFNIAIFTYRYDLMPEQGKTLYEGWFGAVYGLSVLLSPILGSFIMNRLPVINNSIYQHSKFQLLYLISFVLAASVIYIAFFRSKAFNACKKSESGVAL